MCVCGARRYNLYYLFRQHMNFKARANPPKYIRTAADHSEFHKLALRRKQRAVTFSRVKHKDVTERRQTSALQESHILPLRQR